MILPAIIFPPFFPNPAKPEPNGLEASKNPNIETRNKFEIRKPKKGKQGKGIGIWKIRICFEIRISCFEFGTGSFRRKF